MIFKKSAIAAVLLLFVSHAVLAIDSDEAKKEKETKKQFQKETKEKFKKEQRKALKNQLLKNTKNPKKFP